MGLQRRSARIFKGNNLLFAKKIKFSSFWHSGIDCRYQTYIKITVNLKKQRFAYIYTQIYTQTRCLKSWTGLQVCSRYSQVYFGVFKTSKSTPSKMTNFDSTGRFWKFKFTFWPKKSQHFNFLKVWFWSVFNACFEKKIDFDTSSIFRSPKPEVIFPEF